jgi:Golgi phosphoprotein 3 (GPP34)
MDTLGEDLFLLSFRPGKGRLWPNVGSRLNFGLAGAEFIRLAAAGQISINDDDDDKVTVAGQQPTGDPNLDAALASLAAAQQPVSARKWFRRPRPGIRRAYLDPLVAAGTLVEKPARMNGPKYFVTDDARLARLRAILDAAVHSSGSVDVTTAAYAGLAYAIHLAIALYPDTGYGDRLRKAAVYEAQAAEPADGEPAGVTERALRAAIRTATDGAIWGALQAPSRSGLRTTLLDEAMPQF